MAKIIAAILLIVFTCSVALADIARPDKPKTEAAKKDRVIDTTLSIELPG